MTSMLGFTTADDLAAAQLGVTWHRPLLGVTYAFNRAFGYWMLTNVLIHLACAALIYFIAVELKARKVSATLAVVAFALCPLTADAVWSVAGRSSMLCGFFVLTAMLALLKRRWLLCGELSVLAIMSKEEAIVLVPVLFLVACWRYDLIQYRMPTIMVGLMTTLLAGSCVRVEEQPAFATHITQYLSTLGHYLIFPFMQSADPEVNVSFLQVSLALLVFLLLGWMLERHVGVALIFFSLLTYALVPLPDFFEHRLYIALAGLALVASSVRWEPILATAAMSLPLMLYRLNVYSSPTALWLEAVQRAPLKLRPRVNYAGALAYEGKPGLALQQMIIAERLAPENKVVRRNMISLLLANGRFSEAAELLDGK